MPEDLKEFFVKQEKERHSLRLRHRVEQVILQITKKIAIFCVLLNIFVVKGQTFNFIRTRNIKVL